MYEPGDIEEAAALQAFRRARYRRQFWTKVLKRSLFLFLGAAAAGVVVLILL